ncbi:PaaI family thioesterase [Agrobacterium tumefaciens]|uniref:PaaI family thioesterase n=1 Tax=Agrobacterium tumefaciens TaxID=358 RepID=UPI0015747B4D|nr:PaaI family thioesterase [Agrobacterium tumefaciens]NTE68177.1 PaaI family thioesterase [Agrobacterium tumefaciens]
MSAEARLAGIKRGEIEVPLYRLLGLRVVDFSAGGVKLILTPSASHANPYGKVAGGVIASSLDTAAAWVADLQCLEGAVCTTIDIKVNFLRPLSVTDGEAEIVATAIHSGSRIMVAEAKMIRNDGKLVAVAIATLAVLQA